MNWHPTGARVLLENSGPGKDATVEFKKVKQHCETAHYYMSWLFIGVIEDENI